MRTRDISSGLRRAWGLEGVRTRAMQVCPNTRDWRRAERAQPPVTPRKRMALDWMGAIAIVKASWVVSK
jgi:hypothetical protein